MEYVYDWERELPPGTLLISVNRRHVVDLYYPDVRVVINTKFCTTYHGHITPAPQIYDHLHIMTLNVGGTIETIHLTAESFYRNWMQVLV